MNYSGSKIFPVILSGGIGTRLWPMSRESHPKQFLNLSGNDLTLMQQTAERLADRNTFNRPVIVCNEMHRFLVAEQMRSMGISDAEIIIEPEARNTAPAILAAALHIKENLAGEVILVLPSDHLITDTDSFLSAVESAANLARQGYHVTFGIKPEHPETGYGYIKTGPRINHADACMVAAFTEKPNPETAELFLNSGNYLWNSGMFVFNIDLLIKELRNHEPLLVSSCESSVTLCKSESDFIKLEPASYSNTKKISIDYALMERTSSAVVVPVDCGWSDAGTWDSLWRIADKDKNQNAIVGENHIVDSKNCYIRSEEGPAVATLGVDNLIIISTKDAVLVASKDRAQDIKELVEQIKSTHHQLITDHRRVYRPWGSYDCIDSGGRHQVKRITVKPGARISLQMHFHRAEHWVVVAGTAKVTKGDEVSYLSENESIYIPCNVSHRVENPGKLDLDIIEVQSGSYLGEDDIIRFEDTYGRSVQSLDDTVASAISLDDILKKTNLQNT